MIAPSSGRLTQSLAIQSNVSYEVLARQSPEGMNVPMQVGSGKFAKVYKAWQRSARRNVRPVAIKVLHDHATLADERLFKQEIDLLKELTTVSTVHVIHTIDIVHLPPLAMCACGVLYSPMCPRGCGLQLSRLERLDHDYPFLHCPRCGYEISGEDVQQKQADLFRAPAKLCCEKNPSRAHRGTLVNFVDREAVVMELVEHGLVDFATLQQQGLAQIGASGAVTAVLPRTQPGFMGGVRRRIAQRLWPDRPGYLAQRVLLLQKLYLMVQLAEAVAWLHGEKKIVHKDLAPDNVMIHAMDGVAGLSDWRGEAVRELRERLRGRASFPSFDLKVIDFGLADKDELSRSWYEEQDVLASAIKLPYLSPEARRRKERISEPLDISEGSPCFTVPANLYGTYLSVLPGDLIAELSDTHHDHDLEIVRVESDGRGGALAYFQGTPAPQAAGQKFELVRRLGEPHDIYAVGALFYFILTGKHEEVDRLTSLVTLLQEDSQRALSPSALRLDQYYLGRKSAIPEPFLRDELMLLMLRAMVRGRPESFVQSRIDRGPGAAQVLLGETRRIYHLLEDELIAAGLKERALQRVAVALPTAFLLGLFLGMRGC
jgi:serine/threonine protein kinase